MTLYRYTFKSDEGAGASQPNIISVEDPTSVNGLGGALQGIISGDLTTISHPVHEDYPDEYPAGTDTWARLVFRDATGGVSTQWLFDVSDITVLGAALNAAILAAQVSLPNTGHQAVSVMITSGTRRKFRP